MLLCCTLVHFLFVGKERGRGAMALGKGNTTLFKGCKYIPQKYINIVFILPYIHPEYKFMHP